MRRKVSEQMMKRRQIWEWRPETEKMKSRCSVVQLDFAFDDEGRLPITCSSGANADVGTRPIVIQFIRVKARVDVC